MAATQKTYTIPLRKSFCEAAPLKRGPRAVKAVKSYLQRHCKADEVKIGARLNDAIWARGITHPPHKVVVDVIITDGIAKAELQGFAYQEAKKVQKKKEPQTLKERITSKIGVPAAAKAAEEQPADVTTAPDTAKAAEGERAPSQDKPAEERPKKETAPQKTS